MFLKKRINPKIKKMYKCKDKAKYNKIKKIY